MIRQPDAHTPAVCACPLAGPQCGRGSHQSVHLLLGDTPGPLQIEEVAAITLAQGGSVIKYIRTTLKLVF